MPSADFSSTATVCIQRSSYEDIALTSLLDLLEGMDHFVKSGDHVVLKTNLLNAIEPEKQMVTHPAVAGAVAKSVLQVGGCTGDR